MSLANKLSITTESNHQMIGICLLLILVLGLTILHLMYLLEILAYKINQLENANKNQIDVNKNIHKKISKTCNKSIEELLNKLDKINFEIDCYKERTEQKMDRILEQWETDFEEVKKNIEDDKERTEKKMEKVVEQLNEDYAEYDTKLDEFRQDLAYTKSVFDRQLESTTQEIDMSIEKIKDFYMETTLDLNNRINIVANLIKQ